MKISNTQLDSLRKKDKKRPGRGISAGRGKTAGRGTKGQKSRAGHNIPNQFEGGQSNLSLRLPKIRGFRGAEEKVVLINLDQLDQHFKADSVVNRASLLAAGLIKVNSTVKILANGDISKKLVVEGVAISKSALKKIESAKPAPDADKVDAKAKPEDLAEKKIVKKSPVKKSEKASQ